MVVGRQNDNVHHIPLPLVAIGGVAVSANSSSWSVFQTTMYFILLVNAVRCPQVRARVLGSSWQSTDYSVFHWQPAISTVAQSGHRLLHCICLLLTQSRHPASNR